MVPAKAGKPDGPNETWRLLHRFETGIRIAAPDSGPSGSGCSRVVGAAVWPSGATEAAEAVFMVTAEAASAAAPGQYLAAVETAALVGIGKGQ